MKILFKNDYSEGCHPRILEALTRTNLVQQEGYGLDEYCLLAAQVIKEKALAPDSEVHLVSGGTQANLIVISAALRSYESVISARTGHIYDNESGAIEATGHKVSSVEGANGKLTPDAIQSVLDAHNKVPHQLKPTMVYISNSTEIGTTYSLDELNDLSHYCKNNSLYLFMDGARLGHALMAEHNDVSLADVARLTDVFYIGGTKNGALLGEAIVINNPVLKENFGYHLKQKGALLSKGRLLGIQFHELLKDDLYFDLSQHANTQAMRIKTAFLDRGNTLLSDTYTNQIFPILSNLEIEKLSQNFGFYIWKKIDEGHAAIRIITSWATKKADVDAFVEEIKGL